MARQGKPKSGDQNASKKSWRYRAGLVLFVLSFPLFYGTLFIVPFLGLPAGQTAILMSILLGLFYGLWLLSLPLLGREGFDALKAKYKGWWRLWRRWNGKPRN